MTDATYFADSDLSSARHLQRAGQWDAALTALPLPDSPRKLLLRADILTDRHMWRLNEPDQALAAIEVIRDSQPQEARFLTAQLEYWRRILRPGAAEISGDPVAAFASLADDERFGGWSGFWYAVSLDNIEHDGPAAVPGYERALDHARGYGDLLLESYAVRHLGGHAWDAERRSGVSRCSNVLSTSVPPAAPGRTPPPRRPRWPTYSAGRLVPKRCAPSSPPRPRNWA